MRDILSGDTYKRLFQHKSRFFSHTPTGLLQWVLAMCKYYDVAKTVAPKRILVKELSLQKERAEEGLEKITVELAELAANLAVLEVDEREQSAKLKELKDEADLMQRRLAAAGQLVGG
jgi:dynein heavy chain, axonemal